MRLSARLEFDVLALNTPDSVCVLLEVTTLGYGPGYDEELPGAIAEGGSGRALFAEDAATAGGLIADEAEYLLTGSARAVSVTVRGGEHVEGVSLVGALPSTRLDDGALMVELDDLRSGESRRLLLRVSTAVLADARAEAPVPVRLAEVELAHVDPGTLETRTSRLVVTAEADRDVSDRTSRPEVRARALSHGPGERLRGGRNLSDQSFPDAPSPTPPRVNR